MTEIPLSHQEHETGYDDETDHYSHQEHEIGHDDGTDHLRILCREYSVTHDGRPITTVSLAEAFLSGVFILPERALNLGRPRGVCIDEGINTLDPNVTLYAISGAGVGEDPTILNEILPDDIKLKPHAGCGKAKLVLSNLRAQARLPAPTPEEVDRFAQIGVQHLGLVINREVGRTLGFNDNRVTTLHRPPHFHPADGAIIALSKRFPHNLMSSEQRVGFPIQFKMSGHYLNRPEQKFAEFAANEALLTLQIASGDNGIGVVERGFRFTGLIDQRDRDFNQLASGLLSFWDILQTRVAEERSKGAQLNDIHLDLVSYQLNGADQPVRFEQLISS